MTGDELSDAHMEATNISFSILVKSFEDAGLLTSGAVGAALRSYIDGHRRQMRALTLLMLEGAHSKLEDTSVPAAGIVSGAP